jgi:hypothetical protein
MGVSGATVITGWDILSPTNILASKVLKNLFVKFVTNTL